MSIYATVTIEELDAAGNTWRSCVSHMPRTDVAGSIAAIQRGYDMSHTRLKVNGATVAEPARRRA